MVGLGTAGTVGTTGVPVSTFVTELTGPDAEAYAKSVVLADFEEAGDADVLRKVGRDLDGAGKPVGESELTRTMGELMARAVEEIKAGR